MRLKLFGILGALLVLTACESTPWDAASSSGMGAVTGAQGYGNGAGGPGGVGVSSLKPVVVREAPAALAALEVR